MTNELLKQANEFHATLLDIEAYTLKLKGEFPDSKTANAAYLGARNCRTHLSNLINANSQVINTKQDVKGK